MVFPEVFFSFDRFLQNPLSRQVYNVYGRKGFCEGEHFCETDL